MTDEQMTTVAEGNQISGVEFQVGVQMKGLDVMDLELGLAQTTLALGLPLQMFCPYFRPLGRAGSHQRLRTTGGFNQQQVHQGLQEFPHRLIPHDVFQLAPLAVDHVGHAAQAGRIEIAASQLDLQGLPLLLA
jgi:hypothetical protein